MKRILIYLLGVFSGSLIVLAFVFSGYNPVNKFPVNETKPEENNINIDNNLKYHIYTEGDIENRIKVNYPIFINGEEKLINSFELDGNIYVSINELSESLNNLKVHLPNEESNEKGLVIYENSGLGIVTKDNEQYIEISNFVNRYIVLTGIGLPYVYQSVGRTFLDCNNDNIGITKKLLTAYFVNGISSESLFIKKSDLEEEKMQYIKILFENETEINKNPQKYIPSQP